MSLLPDAFAALESGVKYADIFLRIFNVIPNVCSYGLFWSSSLYWYLLKMGGVIPLFLALGPRISIVAGGCALAAEIVPHVCTIML